MGLCSCGQMTYCLVTLLNLFNLVSVVAAQPEENGTVCCAEWSIHFQRKSNTDCDTKNEASLTDCCYEDPSGGVLSCVFHCCSFAFVEPNECREKLISLSPSSFGDTCKDCLSDKYACIRGNATGIPKTSTSTSAKSVTEMPNSTSPDLGIGIGFGIGIVVLLLFCLIGYAVWRRNRKQRQDKTSRVTRHSSDGRSEETRAMLDLLELAPSGPVQAGSSNGQSPAETSSGLVQAGSSNGQSPAETPSGPVQTGSSDGQSPAETLSGPDQARSSDGQSPAETSSGPVQTGSSDGQSPAETPSRPVQAGSSDGQSRPTRPSGPDQAASSDGQSPAETSSGPVQTGSSDGQSPAETSSGPVQTGSSDGQSPAETPSGPVQAGSSDGQSPPTISSGPGQAVTQDKANGKGSPEDMQKSESTVHQAEDDTGSSFGGGTVESAEVEHSVHEKDDRGTETGVEFGEYQFPGAQGGQDSIDRRFAGEMAAQDLDKETPL